MGVNRLLFLRTSAFGDIVQMFYVLSDIRRALPNVEITWCVDERFAELANLHPEITAVISIPTRRWRRRLLDPLCWREILQWIRTLRAKQFDLALDLQGLYKSALIGWLSRTRLRFGPQFRNSPELGAALFYNRRISVSAPKGLAMHPRKVAGLVLGYDPDIQTIDSGISAWRPSGSSDGFFMVGASRQEKIWPAENWISLGRLLISKRMTKITILWGSETERLFALKIASAICSDRITIAPKVFSIGELQNAFSSAALIVGGDTGVTHLAVALGAPTVMIFLWTKAARYTHPGLQHYKFLDNHKGFVTAERVYHAANELMSR